MKVLQIQAKDTYLIRHKMLRAEYPMEDCHFEKDEDDQSFHLGAFMEGRLVSVASFYFEGHEKIEAPNQYRLRGMATLEENQRKGLSSELLKAAFPIIKQNLCSVLWCNARVSAIGFYQKVGFEIISETFDIPDVGPHVLMKKQVT